jgi:dipeptidyl aminopeptidase/acylaminoacyl peptidase
MGRWSRSEILQRLSQSLVAVGTAFVALSCGDNVAPTSTGSLEITTSTSGSDPDADGYLVAIDDGSPAAIGANATLRHDNLAPGTYSVRLTGIAANCTAAGDNPRSVSVQAVNMTPVPFAITCNAIVDLTGNRIAFIADGNVASMREDGSNRVMLTRETVPNTFLGAFPPLRWSPDGTRLLVRLLPIPLSQEIVIVAGDGSGFRVVASGGFGVFGGAWSPDGSRIAYSEAHASHGTDQRVYTVGADGSGRAGLVTDAESQLGQSDVDPAWSPDGAAIAFRGYRVTPTSPGVSWFLFTIRPDGSELRQFPLGDVYGFDWAPDARRFAVVQWRGGANAGYGNILVLDRDGGGSTRLSLSDNVDADPVWSPDGTRLAFTSIRDGNQELYVMNADGSNVHRLTDNPAEDAAPVWSPDGTHLAFQTNRDGNWEIYSIAVDGTGLTNLTRSPAQETAPAWR